MYINNTGSCRVSIHLHKAYSQKIDILVIIYDVFFIISITVKMAVLLLWKIDQNLITTITFVFTEDSLRILQI